MSKQFPALTDDHTQFIAQQPIFFAATTAPHARINLSPKGMDSLRVLTRNRILWLNLTGSGNETAAHLALDPRMTLMWCSFSQRPLILRAYGLARAIHPSHADWTATYANFPATPGARQIYELTLDLVQTSCGYAVPLMDAPQERPTLRDWAIQKGDALPAYWAEQNTTSIDGLPTGILP